MDLSEFFFSLPKPPNNFSGLVEPDDFFDDDCLSHFCKESSGLSLPGYTTGEQF